MEIKILGAGVSGLSVAYHLKNFKIDYDLFEKETNIGGLCNTLHFQNFKFDTALHVIHSSNPSVQKLVMNLLGKNLILHKRRSLVFYNGETIPYPFQVFFPMLSNSKIIKKCIEGIQQINCNERYQSNISNFHELCYKSFGRDITKYFMKPYNEKLFRTSLKNLSWQWAERFVPKIDINDIFMAQKGNVDSICSKYGYNVSFWYPKSGIGALPRELFKNIAKRKAHVNMEARKISLSRRTIEFSDGTTEKWDLLVSSIPLPVLLSSIVDLPSSIRNLSRKLRWVSVYNLNLGVAGTSPSNAHWIYIPDQEYSFYRIGFPSSLSPYMSPEWAYSLSVEASFLPKCSPNFENWKNRIISELLRTKFLSSKRDICVVGDLVIPFAYVIPDLNYKNSRDIISSFLLEHSILNVGRYGLWEYSSIQDSILEGEAVANSVKEIARGNQVVLPANGLNVVPETS